MSCCPNCGYENIVQSDKWNNIGFIPLECESCDILYYAKLDKIGDIESVVLEDSGYNSDFREEIPNLPIGTPVILKNSDHILHMATGIIVDKDHKHYRIEFNSKSRIILWCPEEWIEIDQ